MGAASERAGGRHKSIASLRGGRLNGAFFAAARWKRALNLVISRALVMICLITKSARVAITRRAGASDATRLTDETRRRRRRRRVAPSMSSIFSHKRALPLPPPPLTFGQATRLAAPNGRRAHLGRVERAAIQAAQRAAKRLRALAFVRSRSSSGSGDRV